MITVLKSRYFGLEELLLKGGDQRVEARVRVNAGGTLFETTRATLTGYCTEIYFDFVWYNKGNPYKFLQRNRFRIELLIRSARLPLGKSSAARRAGAFPRCLSQGRFY